MPVFITQCLTVLSIIGAATSIISFIHCYTEIKRKRILRFVTCGLFVILFLLSIYVFSKPANIFTENTFTKIGLFTKNKKFNLEDEILILQGHIRLKHYGEYSVQFKSPFAEIPEFEILNPLGYTYPPKILEITKNQAKLDFILTPGRSQTFGWIARGKPLYPLKIEKILEP